jgi:DNA recombination protein RmuC
MNETLLYTLIAVTTVSLLLPLAILLRKRASGNPLTEQLQHVHLAVLQSLQQATEHIERELRNQILSSTQDTRREMSDNLTRFQQTITQHMTQLASLQNEHITAFASSLEQLKKNNDEQMEKIRGDLGQQTKTAREEQSASLTRFGETLQSNLHLLSESNTKRLSEMRTTLEEKIRDLQADNAKKLEEMRQTVDEKLHATLEQRLGESFKLVSERLEKVHAGLGEMQQLAIGVGDLKRVLTNVKTRGTWGEVQLEMLLQQIMTPDQYEKNVATVPHSNERVEFAIRLPASPDDTERPLWLPIDAKFPKEAYERLVAASENADAEATLLAAKELENTVRMEARTIAGKYLSPPATTDFALLFLPTEGLYAEIIRVPGLCDEIQRKHRVVVVGPTTLSAFLNSLQMGFRTLALQKRSSEVWEVLGAVKTEFGKFGNILEKIKKQLEQATASVESAEVRTRAMNRKLRQVEALPEGQSMHLLQMPRTADADED